MYICDMLRKAAVWILLFVMIFETSGKTMLLLSFEMNRDFIAKELCVKKDIPDNCCKGSCQLTKELKEQDERESKSFPSVVVKSEVMFFLDITSLKYYLPSMVMYFVGLHENMLSGVALNLLRPPGY
jgi:hypothetical protein